MSAALCAARDTEIPVRRVHVSTRTGLARIDDKSIQNTGDTMNLNNLKIRTRLMWGFGLVLAMLLAIVAMSYARLVQSQSDIEATSEYEHRANLVERWVQKSQLNASRMIA